MVTSGNGSKEKDGHSPDDGSRQKQSVGNQVKSFLNFIVLASI